MERICSRLSREGREEAGFFVDDGEGGEEREASVETRELVDQRLISAMAEVASLLVEGVACVSHALPRASYSTHGFNSPIFTFAFALSSFCK